MLSLQNSAERKMLSVGVIAAIAVGALAALTGAMWLAMLALCRRSEMKKKEAVPSYFSLYRFATPLDKLLISFGLTGAIVHGCDLPLAALVTAGMVNSFLSGSVEEIVGKLNDLALYFVFISIGSAVSSFVHSIAFSITAQRQMAKMHAAYFRSLMAQEREYYGADINPGKVQQTVTQSLPKVSVAIGEKVPDVTRYIAMLIASIVISFAMNWKLTLVNIGLMPPVLGAGGVVGFVAGKFAKKSEVDFARAGGLALEVFSNIRTVFSFRAANRETARYSSLLEKSEKNELKKNTINGVSLGVIAGLSYGNVAVLLWYGSWLVIHEDVDVGYVLGVIVCISRALYDLTIAMPSMGLITEGQAAAGDVFAVIDRTPRRTMDVVNPVEPHPTHETAASVEVSGVNFSYPTRPDVQILHATSFAVTPGSSAALIGRSGSGKSTVLSLLMGHFEPAEGQVLLDGAPVTRLDRAVRRSRVAFVAQEPTLFPTTIAANIAFGKATQDASQQEVEAAAKAANAHDFIKQLPQGYNTLVGDRGTQLSGGQKQRIAIARALISKPALLLLDEATSALDSESERLVHQTLLSLRGKVTVLMIAHRLATVQSCDQIFVMEQGRIVESGTHASLISAGGIYSVLAAQQSLGEAPSKEPSAARLAQREASSRRDFASPSFRRPRKWHLVHSYSVAADVGVPSSAPPAATSSSPIPLVTIASADEPSTSSVHLEAATPRDLKKVGAMRLRWTVLRQQMATTRDKVYFVANTLSAFFSAAEMQLMAVIISSAVGTMMHSVVYDAMSDSSGLEQCADEIAEYCFWIIGLAVASFIADTLFYGLRDVINTRFVRRLRADTFSDLSERAIEFFDDEAHTSGKITHALSGVCSSVAATGVATFGTVAFTISVFVSVIVIVVIANWKLGLVLSVLMPFGLAAQLFQFKLLSASFGTSAKSSSTATSTAILAVGSIDTIKALCLEGRLAEVYDAHVRRTIFRGSKMCLLVAALTGVSNLVTYLLSAFTMWYAGRLYNSGSGNIKDYLMAFTTVLYGMEIAAATIYQNEDAKGVSATRTLAELLGGTDSRLDDEEDENFASSRKVEGAVRGEVVFEEVEFSYPTRPGISILNGISFKIPPGKKVALVGGSGCGKSTVMALLEKFYLPEAGRILVDGKDVTTLSAVSLRSVLGYVGQEPALFSGTIAENIRYGRNDAADEEVEQAAKLAEADSFIQGFPEKYQSRIGDSGVSLSGGQKQRIAIARAILLNPSIYLFDETTSALDTETERQLQATLDRICEGKTTITIAHRLSTVVNADLIVVLNKGVVVEQGTHQELLSRNGLYASFVRAQQLFSSSS